MRRFACLAALVVLAGLPARADPPCSTPGTNHVLRHWAGWLQSARRPVHYGERLTRDEAIALARAQVTQHLVHTGDIARLSPAGRAFYAWLDAELNHRKARRAVGDGYDSARDCWD